MKELTDEEFRAMVSFFDKAEIGYPRSRSSRITARVTVMVALDIDGIERYFICQTDDEIREIFKNKRKVIGWWLKEIAPLEGVFLLRVEGFNLPEEFWVITDGKKILCDKQGAILAFTTINNADKFAVGYYLTRGYQLEGIGTKVGRNQIERWAIEISGSIKVDYPANLDVEVAYHEFA